MIATTDIGTLITRHPEIHGGCPIIAGTGVTVRRIAAEYKQGLTSEEIAAEIPHLTLAQVYAALTYYLVNSEAIDADLAVQAAEAEHLETEYRAGIQNLLAAKSAEDMVNQLVFLNDYFQE